MRDVLISEVHEARVSHKCAICGDVICSGGKYVNFDYIRTNMYL